MSKNSGWICEGAKRGTRRDRVIEREEGQIERREKEELREEGWQYLIFLCFFLLLFVTLSQLADAHLHW